PIDEPPWFTAGVLAENMERQPTAQLDAEQRAFLQRVRADVPHARWFGFDLDRDEAYLAMANAATTFEALRPAMAHRERRMQQRVAEILRRDPTAKVALMAGSLHLMKDDDTVDAPGVGAGPGGDTEHSIGHVVTNELLDGPDDVLSIWLLHDRGRSANPWLPPPGELRAAPGTVNAELAAAHDAPTFLPVDRTDAGRRRVTQMHDLVLTCSLPEQVDGIVFVPEVSPLREPGDPTLRR
ncbi:MAG TPA: hypothetical protein VEA78_07440, partial [Acidimicrobiales bacterium]|nr:hypothetical protein [Acidimicrobiales bacterium]